MRNKMLGNSTPEAPGDVYNIRIVETIKFVISFIIPAKICFDNKLFQIMIIGEIPCSEPRALAYTL